MADNMGVGTGTFVQLNHDDLKPLQRKFGEYIKDLGRLKNHIESGVVPVPVQSASEVVGMTDDGFPLLPDMSFRDMKKHQLEALMRTYLNAHYSM